MSESIRQIVERISCTCQSDPLGRCVVHMNEWRPIETAPRDKSFVALLHTSNGFSRYGIGWYMPSWGWQGWSYAEGKQPTHWIPLPAPPVAE
jgi:hypothetical protein